MGMIIAEMWVPGSVVRNQEGGPEFFGTIDDKAGPDQAGFHRGFCTSFRIRPGKEVWFHIPLPSPSQLAGSEGVFLDRVTLLWDIEGAADLCWVTLHHGGVGRRELTEMAKPIAPAGEPRRDDRGLFSMYRNDFLIAPRWRVEMGLQLSLMVRTGATEGDIRFFGAGAAFVAAGS